ncbi:7260_t:CDS:2, partial [Ambispora leptoticha]
SSNYVIISTATTSGKASTNTYPNLNAPSTWPPTRPYNGNNKFETLPMSLRLPFYTVTTDLLIASAQIFNISYGATYAIPWFSPVCEIISAISVWAQSLNAYLFLAVSISTYFRVCRKKRLDYGKYDCKLFLIVFALSILVSSLVLLVALKGGYGPQRWWICIFSHFNVANESSSTITQRTGRQSHFQQP